MMVLGEGNVVGVPGMQITLGNYGKKPVDGYKRREPGAAAHLPVQSYNRMLWVNIVDT